jgi:DNA-binding MarR family transcriptional regulator
VLPFLTTRQIAFLGRCQPYLENGREPHPADRRATLVTFTARGSDAAEALVHGEQKLARQLFADLTTDQLDCFDSVLDYVLERVARLIMEDSRERDRVGVAMSRPS